MKISMRQIKRKIGEQSINELAKSTGFQLREAKKIDGCSFFLGFIQMNQNDDTALNDWAKHIYQINGHDVSGQGVQKKLQFRHEPFAQQLLDYVLKKAALQNRGPETALFKAFSKVLVEDSTCLSLPRNLSSFFPGPHSRTHDECATARIQLRLDLLSDSYDGVYVSSYRENDQSFAHQIVNELKGGELVIRDQGYFVLSAFREIIERNAFILSRLRYGTNVYDPESEQEIDLLKQLKAAKKAGKKVFDKKVLLGSEEKLPVRLVAIEAPKETLRRRRYKASKERNKKANHSSDYMQLLGWTIFITNVGEELWSYKDLIKAYEYRWRIEIIFKCWKSKFNLDKFFEGRQSISPPRATITLYLMLAWLTLSIGSMFGYYVQRVYEEKQKFLSLWKFCDFAKERFWELFQAKDIDSFIDELARYYSHEKRRGRPSYLENLYEIILS
ncbi:MAG: IS4 family transposase [Bacteroidetes bacterium]|nr:MAG: IS4 family transposase [Bacteroidota bacterium]